jgi:hypothetical protein
MAIIQCGECAGRLSDQAVACPHCGAPVLRNASSPTVAPGLPAMAKADPAAHAPVAKSGGVWKWLLGVPLALLAFVIVVGSINSNPEKDRARAAYETCMGSLADNDRARAGNGSFIAGACERMRDEFIRKYGVKP